MWEEEKGRVFKSIQVKSTIYTFSKSSLKKWLQDLINDDVGANEFELFLIGQCDNDAVTFINSINKFQSNELDDKAQSSLKEFDTSCILGRKVSFTCIPYNIDTLEKIVRDSLFRYVSQSNHMMTFEQISLIASATVEDQMISSTHGNGIMRKEFDEELEKRIFLVADKYSPKRISIGIKSFPCKEINSEDKVLYLPLEDKFKDRKIKEEYDWNDDIYEKLKGFLLENTSNKYAYQIFLDTHTSLAFAAGRVLNSKSGINVFPIQKSTNGGTILWDLKLLSKRNYANWNISHEEFHENQYDTALFLNVTRYVYDDALKFIKENDLPIGRIINCIPSEAGATNFAIEDGMHAAILANSIYNAIGKRSTVERRATLHIFAAAPNGFMFFLGQNSTGFGKCILYEYDFEQRDSCTYSQAIRFSRDT
ncbi:SAVED domain-containing protein [Faecalicatena sp. AGMB00832]|uniref:SAVED domain-containing protein n=1 Tax=Faecalicatena faecalis TaxID=2726362 RepID=A0ABS6D0D8_9FIRM|nr:SAVED domain-containing protein [Faecalicatena faecalis]